MREREGQPDREKQRLREDRLGEQTKGQTGGQSEKTKREKEIRTEPKAESLKSSTCKTPRRSDTIECVQYLAQRRHAQNLCWVGK